LIKNLNIFPAIISVSVEDITPKYLEPDGNKVRFKKKNYN
jgi:hypothetical protein